MVYIAGKNLKIEFFSKFNSQCLINKFWFMIHNKTEYNFLRPLGYPSVFRINKVHEFILLMQKPKQSVIKPGASTPAPA